MKIPLLITKLALSLSKGYHLLKGISIALWFSLLFLPFKGPKAAFILFVALSVSIALFKLINRLLVTSAKLRDLKSRGLSLVTRYSSLVTRRISVVVRYSLLLFLIAFPLFTKDYFVDVAILTGIYIILALGLNVVVGFTGLLNLGFVAFYAIGAYTYALLNVRLGFGFWQSLPLCLGLTTISGFILAVPALRLRGDYLAIVTLGFGEIAHLILNNWDILTGGPNGISGISPPYIFGISMGSLSRYYYITLFAVLFTYMIVNRVRSSRIGRAWIAIREDEIGASSIGINTMRYKLYAFAFGAFWAGLAGALFSAKMQFVSPESFTFIESVLILCMVILGGLGSIPGVIIGALILVVLPEVLREVQSYRLLALGAGLIVMMIFRPQGILGGIRGER
ncbi:MAG: high-affinity branched-chain amino acid ABC transporter permease LivM [Thermodesulfovibrionales bacterium]